MPIDLGGVFSRLPDPLGLFSGQGNNGVGTGAKSHPVFGDHGPPRGAGRDAGPGQGPGVGHGPGPDQGPGINAGGPQPGGPALQLPPAPPVPVIHHPASPVALANQVVQHANQALGGLPGGPAQGPLPAPQSLATATSMPGAAATGLPAATPGTPAFTGGPGQPALPSMGGQGHGLASTVASLPGQVVSQLARAMNHALPQGQAHANPQGQAFTGTQGQVALSHSAAHRATETPVMARPPSSQAGSPVPTASANAVPAHAGLPQLAVALAGRPGTAAAHAQPAMAQPATSQPAAAQPAAPNSPATQPAASQPLPGNAAAEARSMPAPAHVPGRAAQQAPANPSAQQPAQAQTGSQAAARPGQAVPGKPAAQQAATGASQAPAGNPAANAASQAANAVSQAQLAAPLAMALAGSTAVEARPVQPGSAERTQLHLDSPHAAGHTAERGLRRGLRNRVDGVRKSLLQMLGLSQLDAGLRRTPDGHTVMGALPQAGKGTWFALPWLFWLLAVVAYGCLALALIVMAGPAVSGVPSGGGGWVMPLVLALGVLAGAGAWLMARAGRGRRSRR